MRSLKAACGVALLALVLSGCGGGTAANQSPSASSTASSSSSVSSSSTTTPPAATDKGTATLSWTAPTTNSDGSPLTDLGGFYIYYGTSSGSLTNTVNVQNPGAVSYTVTNLGSGTWYFAIAAYTNTGVVSPQSNVGSKTIT